MDELVDVVDRDGVKVGTAKRIEVHASGAWHRGIHVLVYNERGELLLQRRASSKDKAPGKLDLSVSEHSKAGETFSEAARRGLREELGIERLPLQRVVKFRMVYGPRDNMVSVLYRSTFAGRVEFDRAEVQDVVPANEDRVRELVEGERVCAPWAREILRWELGMGSTLEPLR